ncbi:MAG: hypothetical protein IJV42_07015 [Bacteroidaceae bacterium]|nr:hypothetical protein [Bacteroidaceae bacterium]
MCTIGNYQIKYLIANEKAIQTFRTIMLCVALAVLSPLSLAQEIDILKFEELVESQVKMSIRNDNNGNPCALIIVNSIGDNVKFENTYVVEVVSHEDEYWIYMAEGAKALDIVLPGFYTKTIIFRDYGINSLKGLSCYRLTINGGNDVYKDIEKERQIVNSIYKQGWNYSGEELSPITKMIINKEALGGKKEAQIALVNICMFEKEYDLAVQWLEQIIEDGDSLCLKEICGDLLYQYAVRIPRPQAYDKDFYIRNHTLTYISDQLILKDEYDKAYQFCMNAYNKGVLDALKKSNEYRSLSNDISIDSLFLLLKSDEWTDISSLKSRYDGPRKYLIVRELSNRGCEKAKKLFEQYKVYIGL